MSQELPLRRTLQLEVAQNAAKCLLFPRKKGIVIGSTNLILSCPQSFKTHQVTHWNLFQRAMAGRKSKNFYIEMLRSWVIRTLPL